MPPAPPATTDASALYEAKRALAQLVELAKLGRVVDRGNTVSITLPRVERQLTVKTPPCPKSST